MNGLNFEVEEVKDHLFKKSILLAKARRLR